MDIDIEELRNTIAMKNEEIKEHKEEIEGLEKVSCRCHFYSRWTTLLSLLFYFILSLHF